MAMVNYSRFRESNVRLNLLEFAALIPALGSGLTGSLRVSACKSAPIKLLGTLM